MSIGKDSSSISEILKTTDQKFEFSVSNTFIGFTNRPRFKLVKITSSKTTVLRLLLRNFCTILALPIESEIESELLHHPGSAYRI